MSEKENKMVPLALVGIGCLFPKANNPREYWRNIREGVDAIGDIPESHWKVSDYYDEDKSTPDMTYARRGGFIDEFDFNPLLYGLSPNNIEATDTTQLLGMVVAREALLDAGYSTGKDAGDGREFNRDRTSVILGVTGTLELVIPLGARLGHPIWRKALQDAGVDAATTEDVVERIADGYVPWQENSFPGLLGNVAAGRIANRFDLGGTNCVVDAACASSLSAIHLAALELSTGRVDMAITGGMDTFNDIFMYMCFSKTPALSPSGNSRPFAKDGDGTILGEGLGAVIMKRLDDAKRDGDKIYAVLKGMGASSDGRGNAIYAPSSTGQTKALWNAYHEADVSPRSIELVEAHGTGTSVGDAVEARALSGVYSQDNEGETWCAIGSVKSMIGHTKAAAGVAGLIKTAMALKHKVLPPSIKVDEPLEMINPGDAPIYLNTIKRPWLKQLETPRRAALSSFGFGGSNFHCVLEEAEERKIDIEWDGQVLIVALSAEKQNELTQLLPDEETLTNWERLRFYAYDSCQSFKHKAKHRLLFIIEKDKTNISKLINDIKSKLSNHSQSSWQIKYAIYSSENYQGKLAFVFPGQGSQYVGMGRDLACQFPQFFQVLQQANQVLNNSDDAEQLTDIIYPIPVFKEADRKQQEQTLRQTQYAQPAIGAVSVGYLEVLKLFNISADVAIGHSFGELTALHAAGYFEEDALHYLSRMRGELMAKGEGDRGSMIAVFSDAKSIEELLTKNKIDLVVANYNAPAQIVLSGATSQVEAFSQIAKQEKIRTIHLPVSAAFHSEFVADATKPFTRIVNEIQFHKNHFPVLSNTTTDTYPDGIDSQKKLLSKQLAKPVRFVEQIQQLYQQGVHTYIEVGPGNVLSGLIKQILNDDSNQIISIDSSLGKQQGQIDLAMVLIALAAQGKEVSLSMWDAQCESLNRPDLQSKTGMTVKISGANIMQKRSVKPPIESKQVESMMNKQQETTMPNRSNNENSSLKVMQDSILALQKMQEQTARLHQQYLQGQETAQQTINSLLQQQQALLNGQAMPEMTVPQQPAVKSAEPNINKPNVEAQQLPETQDLNEVIEAKNDIEIDNLLLKVVSEKTGYPLEMLSLEMSLDTDLGIDSIKRVEILSALQEELPWSPVIKPEELGTFQFLQHIVEFIAAGKPEHFSGSSAIDKVKDSSIQNIEFENTLLNIVSDKTGYPIDMLELDMNLDNDLGIDSIKRVEILSALQEALPQLPTISPDELSNLDSLRSISDLIVTEAISIPANHEVSSTLGNHNFSNELLEVVADKTGYPFDMLSLDMNLDSDLGIDSIKRVEILSAIQERMPELPIVDPDTMATLQTLKSIVEYFDVSVDESNNNLSSNDGVITTGLETTLLEVVSEKTGYPVEMLTLDMNLDSDLGIDSIKRVEILSALQDILPNLPSVSADELSALQTLQQIINTMSVEANMVSNEIKKNGSVHADKENKLKKHSLVRHIINPVEINVESFTNIEFDKDKAIYVSGQKYAESICDELISRGYRARKIDASLEDVENVGGLVICHDAIRNQKDILENFSLIQRVSTSLKSNNGFLVAITEMDGCFGFQSLRENNAIHAALTGIIKTADKEWGSVHCRCIDINKPVMSLLVDTFFYQMPLEVGLNDNNLTELKLVEQRLESKQESSLLNNDDLIVISGGARGVTAEIAVKLAETYQCKLLLLGRSPEPEKEPDWLNNLNEEADIKLVLLEKTERKLSPVELEKQFKAVLANREINKTINNIKSHGSEVAYVSVDITDASSIENAIDLTRIELGNVTGVIHAAGVLADKLIEDKTTEQFEYVFNTKVMGLENLLSVTANDNLKLIANFSSTTARLGRKGQVDYAAANEILNKRAQHEQVIRDDCKVLSINWGPWNGGMVTPALKQVFENEGVGLIELEEGANYFIDEIESNGPVEVVVISEAVNNVHLENQFISDSTINNEVLHLAFERELTVSSYQFLQSHVMNGQAVLPVAVIIEWFAHGALHLNPGMQFQGVEDFRVLKGVSLAASESITLRILTADMKQTGNTASVYAELRSDEFLHATALIVLGDAKNIPTDSKLKPIDDRYIFDNDHYYQNGQLFHGQHLQGIKKVSHCGEEGIMAEVNAAPAPSKWMSQPIRSSWITDPLILDSAFQMMIIWSFEQQEIGSLPTEIESYRQYKKKFPKAGVCVVARITHQTDHKAIADIEFIDKKGALVARMQGYTCVRDGSLKQAFQQNDLIEET